ncbi:MAG: BamA/TamA family outer membrane protein [Bacteroidia bacterium]
MKYISLLVIFCCLQHSQAQTVAIARDSTIKANPQDSTKFLRFYHKVGSVFKDKSFVIAPELGRKPETGVLGGLFWLQVFKLSKHPDSTQRKSNTESYLDYTEKKQILAQIKNNLIFKNERFYLKGENFYNKFPDQFWGIGNETPLSMQQSVSYELVSINQRLLGRISTRYFLGLIYQYVNLSNVVYAKGSTMDTSNISGSHGAKASGVGFDFLYDSRDNILNSYKGFFLEVSSVFNQKGLGGDHYYNNYTIDLRDFLNFGGRKVLAIQALINYNTGDVPFRQMAQIGGDMMMRGYYFGRYRDKLMIAAQAEYRFPVWKWIGLTAFVSGGQVAPTFSGLDWDAVHFTVGACLRIMINKTERLNMGIDSGVGKGTSGLYFNSGEAF